MSDHEDEHFEKALSGAISMEVTSGQPLEANS